MSNQENQPEVAPVKQTILGRMRERRESRAAEAATAAPASAPAAGFAPNIPTISQEPSAPAGESSPSDIGADIGAGLTQLTAATDDPAQTIDALGARVDNIVQETAERLADATAVGERIDAEVAARQGDATDTTGGAADQTDPAKQ